MSFVRKENTWKSRGLYLMLTYGVDLGICKFSPSREYLGFMDFLCLLDVN